MLRKKGVLQYLAYTAGVVDGDWWEMLGTCNVAPEWCLHVPTTPSGTYLPPWRSTFSKDLALPCRTFLFCLTFPHTNPPLDSNDSLGELGFMVCKGVVSLGEASQLYTILTASLEKAPAQWDAVWILVSNEPTRESCWGNPKLPRRCSSRPGKLATLFGRETCKRADELSLVQWPKIRNLQSTAWSAPAVGEVEETSGSQEDAPKQTWHTM